MSVAPILTRALRYGALLAVAVAVVGSLVGFLVAQGPGVLGALVGAATAALFLALTAISLLIAGRATKNDPGSPAFFGIVLGIWLVKLVLFLVLAITLRGQPWLDPYVFFGTVIVAVMGSLIVDVVAFQRSRVPYVSDVSLPGDPTTPGGDERDPGRRDG